MQTQSYLSRLRDRAIYFLVASIIQWAARKFPGLPLPPVDDASTWVIALLASHGMGDVIKLAKEYVQDWIRARANKN